MGTGHRETLAFRVDFSGPYGENIGESGLSAVGESTFLELLGSGDWSISDPMQSMAT